jgi:hypothetical protein
VAEANQPVVAQPVAAAQPPVQFIAVSSVVPVAAVSPTEAVVTPGDTPAVQEVSLGDAAKHNKQHAACLKLAADNPNHYMPIGRIGFVLSYTPISRNPAFGNLKDGE